MRIRISFIPCAFHATIRTYCTVMLSGRIMTIVNSVTSWTFPSICSLALSLALSEWVSNVVGQALADGGVVWADLALSVATAATAWPAADADTRLHPGAAIDACPRDLQQRTAPPPNARQWTASATWALSDSRPLLSVGVQLPRPARNWVPLPLSFFY